MSATTDINVIYLRVLERPYFKMKLISGVIVLSVFNGHEYVSNDGNGDNKIVKQKSKF